MEQDSVGEDKMNITEMIFTGRVFIYSEDSIKETDKEYVRKLGHRIRDTASSSESRGTPKREK